MSRRAFRKRRPKLSPGDSGLEGTVARILPNGNAGFIKPANGAAHIFFSMEDVPYDRQKCVGKGRTVYFDVVARGTIKRRGHSRPQLAAIVRSSQA